MATGPWYTECPVRESRGCEWEQYADNEKQTNLLDFLHLLVKHPLDFTTLFGEDPEIMRKKHAEAIDGLKALL